jgi:polyphosphate kinase
MDKRVEIAWPIKKGTEIHKRVLEYIDISLTDTVKLRELLPDKTFTEIGHFRKEGEEPFNSQEYYIAKMAELSEKAIERYAERAMKQDPYTRIPMRAKGVQAIMDAKKKKKEEEEEKAE